MIKIGEKGYIAKTKGVYESTLTIVEAIKKLPNIKLYGPNNINMVSFQGAGGMESNAISSKMRQHHNWYLSE